MRIHFINKTPERTAHKGWTIIFLEGGGYENIAKNCLLGLK
jgi:hypothetical protein